MKNVTVIRRFKKRVQEYGLIATIRHLFWRLFNYCRYRRDMITKKVKIRIDNGSTYCINVPLCKTDFIQKSIVRSGRPYEETNLLFFRDRLKNGKNLIDIGANIGNHSLYFCYGLGVQKVYAFEPIRSTFEQLVRNIKLNNAEDRIIAENFALGAEKGRAAIKEFDDANIGSTSIRTSNQGEIEIITLDEYAMQLESIDFIKIDVEGFELNVIKGAINTLKKFKPFLFVECFDPETRRTIVELLTKIGYKEPLETSQGEFFFERLENHG